jgi:hypothetical protein
LQKLTNLITTNAKYPLSLTLTSPRSLLSLTKLLGGDVKCLKLTFDHAALSALTPDLALQIIAGF